MTLWFWIGPSILILSRNQVFLWWSFPRIYHSSSPWKLECCAIHNPIFSIFCYFLLRFYQSCAYNSTSLNFIIISVPSTSSFSNYLFKVANDKHIEWQTIHLGTHHSTFVLRPGNISLLFALPWNQTSAHDYAVTRSIPPITCIFCPTSVAPYQWKQAPFQGDLLYTWEFEQFNFPINHQYI